MLAERQTINYCGLEIVPVRGAGGRGGELVAGARVTYSCLCGKLSVRGPVLSAP